jgi:hypothetical protein
LLLQSKRSAQKASPLLCMAQKPGKQAAMSHRAPCRAACYTFAGNVKRGLDLSATNLPSARFSLNNNSPDNRE